MEKFNVFSKWGFKSKPEDLERFVINELSDDNSDQINQLRAEVDKLQETIARLLVMLYANGNGPKGFRLGLSVEQLDDVLGNAGIDKITPA